MKKLHPAAILIAVTLTACISCKWFQSQKPITFDITGKWGLDSMYSLNPKSDSITLLPSLLLAMHGKPIFIFDKDSTLKQVTANDSTVEKYYLSESSLFIREDSVFTPYRLRVLNDSLITLTTNNSIHLRLKRQ